jgi:UDP-glucose 4-epimerase
LFEACAQREIEKLVFASSGGTVYGPNAPVPTPETAATNPISAYGAGKLTLEHFLGIYRRHRGLKSCCLRIANTYGPWQDPLRGQGVVARALAAALKGEAMAIWGDGAAVRDYVYIDDVATALVGAAVSESREWLFNIGSGIGRSLADVLSDVGRVAGHEVVVQHAAGRTADVPVSILDPERAASVLGWCACTNWVDGLHRTLHWLEGQTP